MRHVRYRRPVANTSTSHGSKGRCHETLRYARRGAFAPDNRKHNGLEDPEQFLSLTLMQCRDDGVELTRATLGAALAHWVNTGQRVGAVEWREDQALGRGTLWVSSEHCSTCPQISPGQSFVLDDDLSEWDLTVCE